MVHESESSNRYGACGSNYFRFYDIDNAEAVTTTGQFIIQYIGKGINEYLNKRLKTQEKKFLVYSDTDSCYIELKEFVDRYCPDGTLVQKTNFVDKICKEVIQPEINRMFKTITERYLNGIPGHLLMNRELIGDRGIWTAKKRYLINVRDKEGIRKDPAELYYKGVEIAKSSSPQFCRDAMKAAVSIVMEKDQATLFKFCADTKKLFVKQPIESISFPRGVNGLKKYGGSGDQESNMVDMFEESQDDELDETSETSEVCIGGTPLHTRGALYYNYLLEKHNLASKYPRIKDGEKMKFFYLKEPNPIGSKVMAFLTKMPTEFDLHKYIDWEKQWEKSFENPLMAILSVIGWDIEEKASIDSLFI